MSTLAIAEAQRAVAEAQRAVAEMQRAVAEMQRAVPAPAPDAEIEGAVDALCMLGARPRPAGPRRSPAEPRAKSRRGPSEPRAKPRRGPSEPRAEPRAGAVGRRVAVLWVPPGFARARQPARGDLVEYRGTVVGARGRRLLVRYADGDTVWHPRNGLLRFET